MTLYPSLRIEGGLFAPDLPEALVQDALPGQKPADFDIPPGRTLTNEIGAIFSDTEALWKAFRNRLDRLPDNDLDTSVTRDAWIIPFLSYLGYELRCNHQAYQIDNLTFAISHAAGESETAPPVHIVGYRQELGRLAPSGRPRLSPHALVQEYLNRSEALWGIVTNGRTLRLLRDCTFVRRQAYVEFDLEAIVEEHRFNDFIILYRLLHRSRLPRDGKDPAECFLEKYYQHSIEQGGRVREHLREGVEDAIKTLAKGFLQHPRSEELRQWVKTAGAGELYRQLLRRVYRFLYLLVAEERGLMGQNPFYTQNWSASRLRQLCENPHAYTNDEDLWLSFRSLWYILTNEEAARILGVPPLNGEMFELQEIDQASITNADLLDAFYHLVFYQENGGSLRRVNYAALDTEELGSVYESLLDYHPVVIDKGYGYPTFELQPGSERKSTGSYYTPPELVAELIRSALEPVMAERLEEAKRLANTEWQNLPEAIQKKFAQNISPKESHPDVKAHRQVDRPLQTQPPIKTELARAWKSTDRHARESLCAENALLSIRVLDPACGSGHFLLAAARRLGKELARIRTGEDEPAPEHVRVAVRDVISHCIYGVDKNPLAVELCRVALWLEAHCEGKPLTFLNHRIKCGDSLVGVVNLDVLLQGIPDGAFDPVSDDDKLAARSLKKQNKDEQSGQFDLPWDSQENAPEKAKLLQTLLQTPDDTPEQVRQKAQAQEELRKQTEQERTACDLWTAAFFQRLGTREKPARSEITPLSSAITTATLVRHLTSRAAPPQAKAIAEKLAQQNRFFHWQLEFPEVFGRIATLENQIATNEPRKQATPGQQLPTSYSAGFDVVLGNPPWERIKLQEQEFFASRDAAIARAPNAAARKRLIADLPKSNPALWEDYRSALHNAESASRFLRGSGQYPLTSRGDINTYSVFAERVRHLLRPQGRAGIIVPTGIATDATNKCFFADLVEKGQLLSLFDFDNREKLFPSVISLMKFCLLTICGTGDPKRQIHFAFFCHRPEDIRNPLKLLPLAPHDLAVINPNTRTLPVFRTRQDADLTRAIYQRVPVLVNDSPLPLGEGPGVRENPWGVRFLRMLDMSNDSHLFRTRAELEAQGYRLVGNRFVPSSPSPISRSAGEGEYELLRAGRELIARARQLRREGTAAERLLWEFLRDRRLLGRKFRRQHPIGQFIADFFCDDARLIIEIDGAVHREPTQQERDRLREEILRKHGFAVLRFTNDQIFDRIEKVLQEIAAFVTAHSYEHPSPLSQSLGRGAGGEGYLPLYEAKMLWHYDHRYGTYEGVSDRSSTQLPTPNEHQHADPAFVVQPWYWVPAEEVQARLGEWQRGWLLGFRRIARATDERTAIFTLIPATGAGDNVFLLFPDTNSVLTATLTGNLISLPFDWVVRQKLAGVNMNFFYVEQFPVLPPDAYTPEDLRFIVPRVLELTYTAWDLKPFADDVWNEADDPLRAVMGPHPLPPPLPKLGERGLGGEGFQPLGERGLGGEGFPFPPFPWDESRRALLRAELDAYYARLYGLTRKQLRYILDPADLTERELEDILDPWEEVSDPLDPQGYAARVAASTFPGETFRVLKEKERRQYGEYRTRRLVLEAWERFLHQTSQ